MTAKYIPLDDSLYQYVQSVSVRPHDVQTRLRDDTRKQFGEAAGMQIPPEQAAFMALLLKMMGAQRVLEVGMFTGYSALVMAAALPPEGRIIGLDMSAEYTDFARPYWEEAGVADKIEVRLGVALDTLKTMHDDATEWFDFAFLDADKVNLNSYYELALGMLRHGGVIAIDNALRRGLVIDESHDEETRAIHALNQKAYSDGRVDVSLVTIGDGLLLARKR